MESTARAERLELPPSTAACYTWAVPQKPVTVRLPHAFINRLEQETVEAFRSLSSRGSEIGGLLLGVVAPGNPATVTVENYELIECDYSRGPLFRLSDADTSRFARAIEQHSGGAGPRVMGYFRSHTRKGLALDTEDLAFFDAHLREPHHIVLLVRPFATKASAAGIFIREGGRIAADTSYLEFPFRSSDLGAIRKDTVPSSAPHPTSAPPPLAPLEPPAAPKSPPRAQIVPIAPPRCEAESTAPAAPPAVAPPQNAAPAPVVKPKDPEKPKEAEKAKEPEKVKEPQSPKETARTTEAEKPKEKEKEREGKVAPPVLEKAVEPARPVEETVPAESGSKKVRVLAAVAGLMIILVGGGLFLAPTLMHRGTRPPATAQDSSPLQLRVERTSGGLLLTWNREAEVIRNASRVVLIVGDGDRRENIEMDPNQVRTGSILYPPISQDVNFQMEVTDAKQAKTASESLRVVDPRPSPLAAPSAGTPQQAQNGKPAPLTNPANDITVVAAPPVEASVPEPPVRTPSPAKPFDKESLAARLRPVAPADQPLPDAPSISDRGAVSPGGLTGVIPGTAPLAPPPPRPVEAAPKQASAAPSGGVIVPAEPIYRKAPEYPKVARQTGANGIVEVEAMIGADGKVKNAKVSKGNPMLQKAAIDAVMEWRYKPALLNGKPVESPVQIRLNFVPDK